MSDLVRNPVDQFSHVAAHFIPSIPDVLKNHILPNVVCSSVIQGDTKTPNMLKKYTNLTRDVDDKLYANGVQIVNTDIMGTNGVLYIIDDVLLTDEGTLYLHELVDY